MDASSPSLNVHRQEVEKILRELEVDKKPRIEVMNKIDLLSPAEQICAKRQRDCGFGSNHSRPGKPVDCSRCGARRGPAGGTRNGDSAERGRETRRARRWDKPFSTEPSAMKPYICWSEDRLHC